MHRYFEHYGTRVAHVGTSLTTSQVLTPWDAIHTTYLTPHREQKPGEVPTQGTATWWGQWHDTVSQPLPIYSDNSCNCLPKTVTKIVTNKQIHEPKNSSCRGNILIQIMRNFCKSRHNVSRCTAVGL